MITQKLLLFNNLLQSHQVVGFFTFSVDLANCAAEGQKIWGARILCFRRNRLCFLIRQKLGVDVHLKFRCPCSNVFDFFE